MKERKLQSLGPKQVEGGSWPQEVCIFEIKMESGIHLERLIET